MPRFHARHTTEIRYSGAISQSVNEVRLTSLTDGRQRLEWSSVRAEPAARIKAGRDGFGNAVHRFALPQAHDALVVESEAMGLAAWLRALEGPVGEAISYTRGATRVDTSVEDVVRLRRGVCQDMAHLFLALCRRRGVGSRRGRVRRRTRLRARLLPRPDGERGARRGSAGA
jgi:transglutaminase-like putative cysteine protease